MDASKPLTDAQPQEEGSVGKLVLHTMVFFLSIFILAVFSEYFDLVFALNRLGSTVQTYCIACYAIVDKSDAKELFKLRMAAVNLKGVDAFLTKLAELSEKYEFPLDPLLKPGLVKLTSSSSATALPQSQNDDN
ncbi:hypothetical protein [Aeoliella sp. SH292]|uniref:hypothetical protein n=1 Tax=Aeoliella sp. SH292 TaxID=3454464 RepID=UPI003F96096F